MSNPYSDEQSAVAIQPASDPNQSSVLDLLYRFRECQRVGDVLEALLEYGKSQLGISSIRYYRLSSNHGNERIVYGVNAAGTTEFVSEAMRTGRIRKRESDHPLKTSDTFWAFDVGRPILFQWLLDADDDEPTGRPVLEFERPSKGLPVIRVPRDETDADEFNTAKTGSWIDFPLIVGQWTVGKLSCDIGKTAPLDVAGEEYYVKALNFWNLVQAASTYLEFLRSQHVSTPLEQASYHLSNVSTFSELFNFCANRITDEDFFDCETADILTLSTDSFWETGHSSTPKLVLKATSFDGALECVDSDFYRVGKEHRFESLTNWVEQTGVPLRLSEMLDPVYRQSQLRSYDPSLEWRLRIPVSRKHDSLLICRISGPDNETLGIIRLADKRRTRGEESGFTERDQLLLELIASQCIGPKLKSLATREYFEQLPALLRQMREASLEQLVGGADFWQVLSEVFSSAFPEESVSGLERQKAFLFNTKQVVDGRCSFSCRQFGGNLEKHDEFSDHRVVAIDWTRSLTYFTLKRYEDCGGEPEVIFVSDADAAAAEGHFLRVYRKGTSAMMCPVTFRGKVFGVVGVVSAHLDLSLEQHAESLKLIAEYFGNFLAQREIADAVQTMSGLRHDFGMMLEVAKLIVDEKGQKLPKYAKTAICNVMDCLFEMVDTHSRFGSADPEHFAQECHRIPLANVVNRVATTAEFAIPRNCRVSVDLSDPDMAPCIHTAIFSTCIYNLLVNAIEHAEPSSSAVEVSLRVSVENCEVKATVENVTAHDVGALKASIQEDSRERLLNGGNGAEFRRKGIHVVKRLAELHAVPCSNAKTRKAKGRLEFTTEALENNRQKVSVTLTLPESEL